MMVESYDFLNGRKWMLLDDDSPNRTYKNIYSTKMLIFSQIELKNQENKNISMLFELINEIVR